ncbi:MAG: hypothetical protein HC903_11775 [Methylacidiphilales bacterium]|nr:hypothetical protein [Candidatus Methylacidiphilales bacterium]NJR17817.1 hypothetical protein [Calothrix sp. CSU_2_0]
MPTQINVVSFSNIPSTSVWYQRAIALHVDRVYNQLNRFNLVYLLRCQIENSRVQEQIILVQVMT